MSFFCLWVAPAQAQQTGSVDLSNVTFNSLPPYGKAGDIVSAGDLSEQMGYDPARHWEAGDLPADVFTLGDFQSSFKTQELNLDQVAQLSGLDLQQLRIKDVPFFEDKTFSEVADAVPALKEFSLEEVPALAEVFDADLSTTIGELIDTDELIGNMNFNNLVGEFSVMDIPNLDLAALDSFKNWQATAMSEVPGLGDIGLGKLSQVPDIFSGVTATHDISFGAKENTKTPTRHSITGSSKDGFSVQCVQQRGCAHVELTGAGNMHGAQWIAGGEGKGQQMVNGGEKVLGAVNGGKEPTGRLPFGEAFKVVLDETSESKGTAEFALYFKYCYKGPPVDLGCTPYFLGPIPMPILNSKEKGMIITGFLDAFGGVTSGLQAPKAWEKLSPPPSQDIKNVVNANGGRFGSRGNSRLCGSGPEGIDFKALGDAYKTIESNIHEYEAVGVNIPSEDSTFRSFGLGRYQYMSDREDVRAAILREPGGREFLARTDAGQKPSKEDVSTYFPVSVQDGLFVDDQKQLIQWAKEEGYTGDRLIEVVGQMHFGGPNPAIRDSAGTDANGMSIRLYGEKLNSAYRDILQTNGSFDCGKSTGTLISPIGTAITSRYGYRIHPIFGDSRFHSGTDFGAYTGQPILAADGGVITYAGGMGGYGNTIVIEHGDIETLYAHLSQINVNIGDSVAQGDEIGLAGSTGNSTGPHLHFEVRVLDSGGSISTNPEDYL